MVVSAVMEGNRIEIHRLMLNHKGPSHHERPRLPKLGAEVTPF